MNSGKLALGIVAAAAAGAILGLLFAPAKGKVLRRKIRSMSTKEMDDLKEKYSDLAESISKKYDKIKDDLNNLTHKTMQESTEKMKAAQSN